MYIGTGTAGVAAEEYLTCTLEDRRALHFQLFTGVSAAWCNLIAAVLLLFIGLGAYRSTQTQVVEYTTDVSLSA
jgi:hypothetical protein